MNPFTLLAYIWNHPANRECRATAILRAICWQTYKRLIGKPRDINVAGRLIMRCYPDSPSASAVLYCNGWPDFHEMRFLEHYLKKGDYFVDIGSNVGVYTLLGSVLVGNAGHVDAFEPSQDIVKRVYENVILNNLQNVLIHQKAISDTSGSVQFSIGKDTMNSIVVESTGTAADTAVQCTSLDDLYGSDNNIALIKMDIEGAEPIAFRGAGKLIERDNPPVWLIEINGLLHRYGFSEEEFSTWLSDRGYDLCTYDSDKRIFHMVKTFGELQGNYFAVSRRKRDFVLERCKAELITA